MKLRLPVVLALALTVVATGCTEKKVEPIAVVKVEKVTGPKVDATKLDFVALAEKAYPVDGDPNREAMDELWSSLYALPEWKFMMTPATAQQLQPAMENVGNDRWLYVFTDSEKLAKFAKDTNNLSDGGLLFLAMTPEEGKNFILKSPATGVRFNHGSKHGWFAPAKNVGGIYDYLKQSGKI